MLVGAGLKERLRLGDAVVLGVEHVLDEVTRFGILRGAHVREEIRLQSLVARTTVGGLKVVLP